MRSREYEGKHRFEHFGLSTLTTFLKDNQRKYLKEDNQRKQSKDDDQRFLSKSLRL